MENTNTDNRLLIFQWLRRDNLDLKREDFFPQFDAGNVLKVSKWR